MEIRVTDRSLYITEDETLVAGSVLEYTVHFTFSEAWAGYAKTAVFKTQGGHVREVPLTDDTVTIPWDALAEAQYIRIGMIGAVNGHRRPTLWSEMKYVENGAENATSDSIAAGSAVIGLCVLG